MLELWVLTRWHGGIEVSGDNVKRKTDRSYLCYQTCLVLLPWMWFHHWHIGITPVGQPHSILCSLLWDFMAWRHCHPLHPIVFLSRKVFLSAPHYKFLGGRGNPAGKVQVILKFNISVLSMLSLEHCHKSCSIFLCPYWRAGLGFSETNCIISTSARLWQFWKREAAILPALL